MRAEPNQIRENAMMAVFEVFEKMYYTFLEPGESEPSDVPRRVVQIEFTGTLGGDMYVYYSKELAETMIENALGLDKGEITHQVVEDCLKECINMICGNFLQKIEPDKVLQLSIPRYMGELPVPRDIDPSLALHLTFESDGMPLDVILKFAEGKNQIIN